MNYDSAQLRPDLKISIKAKNIIVAIDRPQKISAQNILQVEIKEIIILKDKAFLYTQLHDQSCLAEMTQASLQRLSLNKGQKVFLIMKASAIEVL